MSLGRLPEELRSICQQLAGEKGRLHIVDTHGNCLCVLISKSELESLEEALVVLSDDDEVRAVRKSLARVVAAVEA
jgi:PHD/YefM family antitoxin component YafN of YafNO toxin-antitoxin module